MKQPLLDKLESKRVATHRSLSRRFEQATTDADTLVANIDWLSDELEALYREALDHSKRDIPVSDVFRLWQKMVGICDYFMDQVTAVHSKFPESPLDPSRIVELRIKCEDKMELHRC